MGAGPVGFISRGPCLCPPESCLRLDKPTCVIWHIKCSYSHLSPICPSPARLSFLQGRGLTWVLGTGRDKIPASPVQQWPRLEWTAFVPWPLEQRRLHAAQPREPSVHQCLSRGLTWSHVPHVHWDVTHCCTCSLSVIPSFRPSASWSLEPVPYARCCPGHWAFGGE